MNKHENYNDYYQKIILTLGKSHYVLPIKSYYSSPISPVNVGATLADNSKIETSSNNVLLVTDESELIEAILKNPNERYYMPEQGKYGKVKMKKISIDSQINGDDTNE